MDVKFIKRKGNTKYSLCISEKPSLPIPSVKPGKVYIAERNGSIYVVVKPPKRKSSLESIREATGVGAQKLKDMGIEECSVTLDNASKELWHAATEGIALGYYTFSKYKSNSQKRALKMYLDVPEDIMALVEDAYFKAHVANYVRDLVNEPGSQFPPERFIDEAKSLGLDVKVFKEKDLEASGMKGILTVGAGSKHPPVFVHISYTPANPKLRLAVIGKGVTFDSGGLNIKSPNNMERMKSDKAGACCVLGVMKYLREKRPPIEVHGLIPAVENMPDGGAYRPDDIIVYKNGVSVEIYSTDAEGRLILADALIYASELKPDIVIDVATLTGACMVALGRYTSGLFCTNDLLAHTILECAEKAGENMWRLPFNEWLEDEIEGTHADVRNTGKSRYGGTITAALFLKRFVRCERWAHIDIAGPAFLESPWRYFCAGATGHPTRTLINLLEELSR